MPGSIKYKSIVRIGRRLHCTSMYIHPHVYVWACMALFACNLYISIVNALVCLHVRLWEHSNWSGVFFWNCCCIWFIVEWWVVNAAIGWGRACDWACAGKMRRRSWGRCSFSNRNRVDEQYLLVLAIGNWETFFTWMATCVQYGRVRKSYLVFRRVGLSSVGVFACVLWFRLHKYFWNCFWCWLHLMAFKHTNTVIPIESMDA